MEKYNTQRSKLKLPEYGRHVQNLVEYCKSIQDRQKRTQCAYTIIEVMADIYPDMGNVLDKDRILWDHLALLSNFELDVDYPYPIVDRTRIESQPEPLNTPQSDIHLRMYGKVMEQMIQKATQIEDEEERIGLFEYCANQMKRNFHLVNKDATEDDDKIIQDLVTYAGEQFREEIYQIYLYSLKELQQNSQYDPAKLVETKKKKKKKKKK